VSSKQKITSKKSPQTMEDLLSLYGKSVKGLTKGDHVHGVIIEKLPGKMIVDIGGKSEGIVAEKAYKEAESLIKELNIGDEIDAQVIVPETQDGFTILSLRQATKNATWDRIKKAKENITSISVEVKVITPAGVMVDVNGLTGFIPRSQLGREVSKNIQNLIGKRLAVTVIDLDRDSNKVILSEKEISEKEELILARQAMKEIKEGEVFDGVVSTLYDFGGFVKIIVSKVGKKRTEEVELEGLVHVSEIAWDKISKPDDVLSLGEEVRVKVIGKGGGKLALSIKQIQKDPWDQVTQKYPKEKRLKGKVTKLTDFGVFVQLEPGIEGLIHMTKIPPGKRFNRGDEADVIIEEIDKEGKKISLGLILTEKPIGYK